jgi:hypothetical protein
MNYLCFMKDKNTCDICGFVAKPRGLGAHKRIKHGITERLVLSNSDLSTEVKGDLGERSFDLSKMTSDLSKPPFDLSERNPDLSQKVIRPSDYIPKKALVEKRISNTSDTISSLQETVLAQSGIIKNQGLVINTILPVSLFDQTDSADPKMVEKLSTETGQALSECKRPDREHLYTKQDLHILMAKLARTNWGQPASPGVANLLSFFNAQRVTDSLIADFERRFQCKFEEVKRANPDDIPGGDNNNWSDIIGRYSNLPYSR